MVLYGSSYSVRVKRGMSTIHTESNHASANKVVLRGFPFMFPKAPNNSLLVACSLFDNMTSETTPLTPPPLVRIVCSPYDSDNDNEFVGATSPNSSFIYPSSERKKARARGGSSKIKFFDEISRNAAGFGQSMAVHANHTLQRLVAPETDNRESDGYDSDDDSQRRWRKSKLDMLMVKALDKADMYAAALCNVADHVPTGCIGNGFICGVDDYSDDGSWSSYEEDTPRRERRSRTKKSKRTKKQASSAVPYRDGNLSDSLSITSDDVSYTFEEVKKSPTTVMPSPKKITAIAPCPKASSLRQRREEFLRRKDSGGEAIAVSRARVAKRHQIKKKPQYVPSQELRAKYFGSNRGEFDRERSTHTMQEDDELYGESIPDLVDSSSNDDSADKKTSSNYKWQSKLALVDIPVGDSLFLTSSHLGPSVSRVPFEMGNALQMGDIILRVDGEDVSSIAGSVVENILKSMRGKKVHVSFLRKRMSA